MKEIYFIDAGYFIALEYTADQSHKKANEHFSQLLKERPSFLTTTYILDETLTFFNSRNLHSKALEIYKNVVDSSSIELIHVSKSQFNSSFNFFEKYNDKRYSLTDCISFVIMTELKVTKALTFDKHFEQAGFQKFPK